MTTRRSSGSPASLLRRGAVRARERDAYDAVFVDEYQDTDPAQEELLVQLAGDGRELIAVGDPDQSIYAFRGADVDALRRFPGPLPRPGWQSGAGCRAADQPAQRARAAGRFPPGGGPAAGRARPASRRPGRSPCARSRPGRRAGDGADRGRGEREPGSRADRRHPAPRAPDRRLPWSRMAVLVRSAVRQVAAAAARAHGGRRARPRWPATSCRCPPSPAAGRCCGSSAARSGPRRWTSKQPRSC